MTKLRNDVVENMKKAHPEWFSAVDYHWMDDKVKHDFWSEALSCDYSPENGVYSLFEEEGRPRRMRRNDNG